MRNSDKGRPLQVAMISYYLPSGSKIGVGYWVDQLAREMCRRGHSVTVYSGCGPVPDAPYRVVQAPLSGSLRTFKFALHLRKVDFSGYDVIHAHGDDYWLWRQRTPRHIRTLHGSCFSEAIHIRGGKEKLRMVLLGLSEVLATLVADETVVVSPATRKWTPWVRTVVPAAPDLRRFRPAGPIERSANPSILFVGTYGRRKRGWLVAQAFSDVVRPAIPDAELWMVSEDVPAIEGVRQLGRVPDDELVHLYQTAWIFCLPSSYEGFGIPYLEAMAAGLPVVATPNPGSRYILFAGEYGVLVSDKALGDELKALLGDGSRRRHFQDRGLRRAETMNLERSADEYERLYRSDAPRPTDTRTLDAR